MKPCVGIDLGTTASALAVVQDGVPTLVDIDGGTLLPSVVLYGDERLVGQPALNALPLDPRRGVLSSKRMLGTNHVYHLGDRLVRPMDVAEHVLTGLLDGAERSLGWRPDRAVITVPAWFTSTQRAETRSAGEAAGLTVERIINEPTAAALAHALGDDTRRTVLVYDLGGGTFDVSLVRQDGPLVEVVASHGDSRLGGDDIDAALVDHVLGEVDADLRAAIDDSGAAKTRLRLAVEEAKVALSSAMTARIQVPFLVEVDGAPRHLDLEVDRSTLDALALPLIERTLKSVNQVARDAGIDRDDIDELLLVGGATLQPLVWHVLNGAIGLEGSHAIDPRRVVALGAALQGAIVDGSVVHGMLLDVAPYSLSVGALHERLAGEPPRFRCTVMTPRNAGLPSRHAHRFSTVSAFQRKVRILLFQGGDPDPRNNRLLGHVDLGQLPPAPLGEDSRPMVVTCEHDLDGQVRITLTDELSGRAVVAEVAADGEAQDEMWAEELERLELDDLLGEHLAPTAPDALHVIDALDALDLDDGVVDEVPAATDDEARATFEAVLAARASLAADHAAHAAELIDLAERGLAAIDGGHDGVALYDALTDRMFDLGIYL